MDDRIWSEEVRRRAVWLYLGGASLRRAGEAVGASFSSVKRWVLDAGHELRTLKDARRLSQRVRPRREHHVSVMLNDEEHQRLVDLCHGARCSKSHMLRILLMGS
jgi:transposase-like protein